MLVGLAGTALAFWRWSESGYGNLDVETMMRLVIPSVVLGVVGLQLFLTSFLVEMFSRPASERE
jgi:ABC-type spermidine/putrescine transport system permease subunit II